MKRVLIAIAMLLAIIAASSLSLWDMQHSIDHITEETLTLRNSAEDIAPELLAERCRDLMEQWDEMEERFLLYVRHDHLDNIMEHLSELPAFCQEEEYAELLSNLDAAIKMLRHLRESITPDLQTLL